MSLKTCPEGPFNLGRQNGIHTVKAGIADALGKYVLKHIEPLIPLLWTSNTVIEKKINLSIDMHQGGAHKITVMTDAKLNWESRILNEDGQLKIEATLRVDFSDELRFPFLDEQVSNIH